MALNENAVITAAGGYVFVADPGTAPPTEAEIAAFDPENLAGFTWGELIGHTSRDDLPEFGFDGGDTETRGTWQNGSLRQVVTEVPADYMIVNLVQLDETALELYYGQANDNTTVVGRFDVNNAPTRSVEKAILVIIVDGDVKVGFCAPKAGIKREDSIELDIENFAALPIRATFLKHTGSTAMPDAQPIMSWISGFVGQDITPPA